MLLSRLLIPLSFALAPQAPGALPVVTLYSPYDFEPFVNSETQKSGLMYDLQQVLNAKGSYQFEVQIMPRSRVIKLLEKGEACVIPWVAPEWFDDPGRSRYQWTLPLAFDENVIVSPASAPIDSLDPAHFQGKTTVTMLGFKFPLLDELVLRGTVKAIQLKSPRASFLMLARQRIDFLLTGRIFVQYFAKQLGISDHIHVSALPNARFERRILICAKQDPALRLWLDQQISELPKDRAWQDILRRNFY